MYINITVTKKRDAAFLKLCPKAIVRYRTHDNNFMFYKITDKDYQRNYRAIDDLCNVEVPKSTNYVKLMGKLAGQEFKLFVRETQVYKVLASLEKRNNSENSIHWQSSSLSISMRKVKIANGYNKRLEPIVVRSLAYAGIAA